MSHDPSEEEMQSLCKYRKFLSESQDPVHLHICIMSDDLNIIHRHPGVEWKMVDGAR